MTRMRKVRSHADTNAKTYDYECKVSILKWFHSDTTCHIDLVNIVSTFTGRSSSTSTKLSIDRKAPLDADLMDELNKRLNELPQELYDTIYDLTFTYTGPSVVYIDKYSKRPGVLQVSWATREKFGHSYYKATTFRFLCQPDTGLWCK